MKAKTKRYISLFLALVFCFSLLGTLPAFAATTVQAYMVNYPRQNDPNYGDSRFGHSANYLMSGWAYVAYERMTLHAIGSYNGQIAYCIEPGVDQDSGDTLTSTDESYWDNYPASSNVTIPPETIKTLLGRVLTYGYHGNISQNWMTGNASDADSLSYAIATQMLVWEVVVGERDANFDHVDPSAYGKGAVMDYIGVSNPLRSQIMHFLHKILVKISDAVADRERYENDELVDTVRRYAENGTDSFYERAYDWRETESAGRWAAEYPVNVLFADDDLDSFIHELEEAMDNQRYELNYALRTIKNSVGTDLEKIVEGLAGRKRALNGEDGFNNMTAFYLHCVAAHLYGEYRCDSCFYNTSEWTAFICAEDIESVKADPSDWALVMFDYHY